MFSKKAPNTTNKGRTIADTAKGKDKSAVGKSKPGTSRGNQKVETPSGGDELTNITPRELEEGLGGSIGPSTGAIELASMTPKELEEGLGGPTQPLRTNTDGSKGKTASGSGRAKRSAQMSARTRRRQGQVGFFGPRTCARCYDNMRYTCPTTTKLIIWGIVALLVIGAITGVSVLLAGNQGQNDTQYPDPSQWPGPTTTLPPPKTDFK